MGELENTPYRLLAILTNKWFDEWLEEHREEVEVAKKGATFKSVKGGLRWGPT